MTEKIVDPKKELEQFFEETETPEERAKREGLEWAARKAAEERAAEEARIQARKHIQSEKIEKWVSEIKQVAELGGLSDEILAYHALLLLKVVKDELRTPANDTSDVHWWWEALKPLNWNRNPNGVQNVIKGNAEEIAEWKSWRNKRLLKGY